MFLGLKMADFRPFCSPRLPNQSEPGDTALKSTVFKVSNDVLVGFFGFLVAVDVSARHLCHVVLVTKSATLGSTAIELGYGHRKQVTKPESRGAGVNCDVFRSKIRKIFCGFFGPKNEKNGRDPESWTQK